MLFLPLNIESGDAIRIQLESKPTLTFYEKRKSNHWGMTWGWSNDDRNVTTKQTVLLFIALQTSIQLCKQTCFNGCLDKCWKANEGDWQRSTQGGCGKM